MPQVSVKVIKVYSNSGSRVTISDGRTVILGTANNRTVLEKIFVGEKVTRAAKVLTNWQKRIKEK